MITIIDYKSGNLRSISNSFKKIGVEALITSDPSEIANAKHLVLPGVGAFGTAMENIDPFKDVIFEHIDDGKPFLGICLGLPVHGCSVGCSLHLLGVRIEHDLLFPPPSCGSAALVPMLRSLLVCDLLLK